MRNIQFSTRETDLKVIFFSSSLLTILLVSFLPAIWLAPPVSTITPMLSFAFALFAWGVFKIIEPPFYGRTWSRSKAVGIPALWLFLFISFTILLCIIAGRIEAVWQEFEEAFYRPTL
jgi:hypothetical protein